MNITVNQETGKKDMRCIWCSGITQAICKRMSKHKGGDQSAHISMYHLIFSLLYIVVDMITLNVPRNHPLNSRRFHFTFSFPPKGRNTKTDTKTYPRLQQAGRSKRIISIRKIDKYLYKTWPDVVMKYTEEIIKSFFFVFLYKWHTSHNNNIHLVTGFQTQYGKHLTGSDFKQRQFADLTEVVPS